MGEGGGIRYSESGGREKAIEARMGLAKGREERRESQKEGKRSKGWEEGPGGGGREGRKERRDRGREEGCGRRLKLREDKGEE